MMSALLGLVLFVVRLLVDLQSYDEADKSSTSACFSAIKGNSGIFKPRPYFWHEIRSSTHREQFGESRRPSGDI